MSSSLTFQLRQQQKEEEQKHSSAIMSNLVSGVGGATTVTVALVQPSTGATSLPSPPSSSYGDESSSSSSSSVNVGEKEGRRDSLPTHFNALTLQNYSTSLPENYTIEHSASPIPIVPTSPRFRHKHHHHNHHHHYRTEKSPSFLLSPTATAAATGGLTIRGNNARALASSLPSCPSSYLTTATSTLHSTSAKQKPSISATTLAATTTTAKALHRCEDCGKVYKHPSCLSKHRWEHSEEWELTSKLLLTKHQQVQMLEAAAILVSLDTQRVEQQQQRMIEQQQEQQQRDHATATDTEDEDDDGESIHVDDDDDDDDDIIVDMEMDEEPLSSAPPPTTSTTSLFPNSVSNSG